MFIQSSYSTECTSTGSNKSTLAHHVSVSGSKSSPSEGENDRHPQRAKTERKMWQSLPSTSNSVLIVFLDPFIPFQVISSNCHAAYMPAFVAVSILVLSCIFLLTTTSKALYSCAISGGIQFSYHRDYMTMTFSTSFSIMALASNDGQEKQSIARRSKKPGKIVTPEAIEEKEQERLN